MKTQITMKCQLFLILCLFVYLPYHLLNNGHSYLSVAAWGESLSHNEEIASVGLEKHNFISTYDILSELYECTIMRTRLRYWRLRLIRSFLELIICTARTGWTHGDSINSQVWHRNHLIVLNSATLSRHNVINRTESNCVEEDYQEVWANSPSVLSWWWFLCATTTGTT